MQTSEAFSLQISEIDIHLNTYVGSMFKGEMTSELWNNFLEL